MPTYVYGCVHLEHERVEVYHGMKDEPEVICETCGERMHRIPQAVDHYHDPRATLLAVMEKKYTDWRMRRKKGVIRG